MAQANVKLTVDASQATRALRGVQQQSSGLERAFGGLKSAILGVGVTALGRQAILTSANFEKLNVRLGLLTKASGTFARSQEIAAEAQKLFGLSATEALDGITNITGRLQPLGVGVEDIRTTFIGFNTAAKLSGANAIEASNAFRQLAQALGSGRLQGDEFRSIAEQVPKILKPVADELGTTVGELKKFSAEGKITSAVVIRALKKIEVEGRDSLKTLLENDPTQVFKDLGNEAENLSRAFGDALAPAILPVIRGFTEFVEIVTNFVNSGGGKVTLVFTGIGVALKGISFIAPLVIGQISALVAQFQIAAINTALASTGLKGVAASSFVAAGGVAKLNLALAGLKVAIAKTGLGLAIIAVGALAAKFLDNKAAAEASAKATEEFNKQLGITVEEGGEAAEIIEEITKKQRELNKERIRPATKRRLDEDIKELKNRQKILNAEKERSEELTKADQFNDKTIEFLKSITELENQLSGKKQEQITLEERIQAIKQQHGEEDSKQLIELLKKEDSLIKQVQIMNEQKLAAEELKKKFNEIGQSVENNIVQNLTDAVMGAQTLGEALTNVLKGLQRQLIEMAMQNAVSGLGSFISKGLGAIFGGGGGGGGESSIPIGSVTESVLGTKFDKSLMLSGVEFANGGKPPVGKASLVGEKGPELFVPQTSGTIIPNHALGGTTNVVVNVDASGNQQAQGDDQSATALGEVIAAAVQSEIAKQQMDGGLLS